LRAILIRGAGACPAVEALKTMILNVAHGVVEVELGLEIPFTVVRMLTTM
jgi:hypothetical protein